MPRQEEPRSAAVTVLSRTADSRGACQQQRPPGLLAHSCQGRRGGAGAPVAAHTSSRSKGPSGFPVDPEAFKEPALSSTPPR